MSSKKSRRSSWSLSALNKWVVPRSSLGPLLRGSHYILLWRKQGSYPGSQFFKVPECQLFYTKKKFSVRTPPGFLDRTIVVWFKSRLWELITYGSGMFSIPVDWLIVNIYDGGEGVRFWTFWFGWPCYFWWELADGAYSRFFPLEHLRGSYSKLNFTRLCQGQNRQGLPLFRRQKLELPTVCWADIFSDF